MNKTFTINVPATATLGKTLLRICYSDAWADVPEPCGELAKGFAMEIPLEIVEQNSKVEAADYSFVNWQGDTLRLSRPARLFVYSTGGALLDQTLPTDSYSVSDYLHGTYVILAVESNGTHSQIKFVK